MTAFVRRSLLICRNEHSGYPIGSDTIISWLDASVLERALSPKIHLLCVGWNMTLIEAVNTR